MMEQFISNSEIARELAEFDEKTVNLYMVGIDYIVFDLFFFHVNYV